MSISGKTSLCTRTKRSGNAGKSQQPQQHTTKPDNPQIPQPDLRFVKRNNKPDTQKGPEPKQKHPPKRFAKGHSGLTTASLSKTCENELRTTTFKQTWRPKHFACLLWQRCAEAVHDHGATTVPLSASSQISLSRGPPWTESLSYILREQECRGGHCARYPPSRGGGR